MRNRDQSKLIYFLASLDSEGQSNFRDFLQSPIFNKQEAPRKLYEHVRKCCLGTIVQEIDDEIAWKAVWGELPSDLPKLQKLKTSLLNLLLEYFAFRNWHEKPAQKQIGLLEELNLLEEETYFRQYHAKANRSVLESKHHNIDHLAEVFGMEVQFMTFLQRHGARSHENHLQATMDALGNLLLGYMFKFAYIADNQARILGTIDPYHPPLPAWMQAVADAESMEIENKAPLIRIYALLFRTRSSGANPEDLSQLRQLLLQNAPGLPSAEADDLFTGTINNFNRQVDRNSGGSLAEILELYKSMVEVQSRRKTWKMLPWHFKNAVSIGSRLGQFEWVAQFLANGRKLLGNSEEEIDCFMAYNEGVFCFYKGDYARTEKLLNEVLANTKDIFHLTDARAYLLMAFFETGDSLGFEALVHSFRMYLQRSDRLSANHKDSYFEFIGLLRRLMATPENDHIRLQQLKADIAQLRFNAGKYWLMQKLRTIGRSGQ